MTKAPRSFAELVGYQPKPYHPDKEAHGTTVLSLEFDQGVVTFADRRATMGNMIMFDQAEKVFALDDRTVVAISGSFARSVEICRLLKHSFKYYRRMQFGEMSLEGKLQEISRALASNLGMAMEGIGVFLPIVAAYDPKADRFGVYFFDTAGARFQSGPFAAAGSGSTQIRGIFDYITKHKGAFNTRSLEDVLVDGLEMLQIAADLDSATGGIQKNEPIVRVLSREGNQPVSEKLLRTALTKLSQ
ncbi:MAG: hypothetical protein JNK63_00250 [Chthonomonas sp.]|nr:hypothetical protein [Chthonomonas sp.]